MKDEKNLNERNKEEIVTGKYSGEKSYSEESLHDELEKLAETFRQELKKAQEMSEEEFEEVYADEEGIIPNEELCACCGEKRRDKSFGENYEYCADCRDAMTRYPLSIQGILVAIVMVGLAIFSVINFASDFSKYDLVYKGDKCHSEKKLVSAVNNYDSAVAAFLEEEILPKRVMLKCAQGAFETMDGGISSMNYVSTLIEEALNEVEAKLPLYNGVMKLYDENAVIKATMQEFYNLIQKEEYAKYEPGNDELYKTIMADIEALLNKKVTVTSVDAKTSKQVASDEAIVRFCQYMFAYTSEEYDDSLKYMYMVQDLAPSYYWLYGYELGLAELQSGNLNEARTLAKKMLEQNVENADAYSLNSSIDRMKKNYTKAVKWADDGLKYNPDNAELYRFKAMAFCAEGDYENAKKAADSAIEIQSYALVYMTSIVIENELGNTDRVQELKDELKEQEVELTEKMNNYLDGKITATEMFTEGTGDVQ